MLSTSCNNDDDFIVNNEQQIVQKDSEIIIYRNGFHELVAQIGSTKAHGEISDNNVWDTASFSILKDGKEVNILDYVEMLKSPHIPQTRANKPTLEEIRNVLNVKMAL